MVVLFSSFFPFEPEFLEVMWLGVAALTSRMSWGTDRIVLLLC